ncbi:MAG: hypothetical protein C4527_26960 [Candidatus Omnitrophota bacterium]|nr:MAG: hypothetical protein C4527_26960 [Candidatus Omnitrophota bacterium]
MKQIGPVLLCCIFAVTSVNGQTIVEDFFTAEGGSSPITLNGGQKCGQRFVATQPFEGIQVNGPTWSVSGEKGMTIRLYEWVGNYAATVAQAPIAVSVLENLNDNDWFLCPASRELPPGVYFWEASEPTNSNPNAVDPHQIGCWLYNGSRYQAGEAYFNGAPYDEVSTEWFRWYGDDQTGTWTPFPFTFEPNCSLSQQFDVPFEFNAVGIASPTWNGFGAAYRMSLFRWNRDYDTTVAQTPIARKTFTNLSDNARNELVLDSPAQPGVYLLVTDEPVPSNTGLVGHWGWVNSPWADNINVAFVDGVPRSDFASYDIFVGGPTQEVVGKDFASRSVTGVAVSVDGWEVY